MLGDLYLFTTRPTRTPILARPVRRPLRTLVWIFSSSFCVASSKRLALVSAQPPELRVATGNEALARIILIARTQNKIVLIEQPQLKRFALDQSTNLRGFERRDPVQPREFA